MDVQQKLVSNPGEFDSFKAALRSVGLPHSDLNYKNQLLISYYDNNELIGTAGIEIKDRVGLLRSVSVPPKHQRKKLGTQIIESILSFAKENNLYEVYLLTETAKDFFNRFGFTEVSRDTVPSEIKSTTEFASVCPASAVCMKISLKL